jgi:hypothetical protein
MRSPQLNASYIAAPAPVPGHQRQVHRRGHRTVRAQQRVHEFEQFVPAHGQTVE